MKFDILILAAGFGSRLKSLTKQKPKALVEYKKKKFIERQVECFDREMINKIIVVIGYKSHKIKFFLKTRFPDKKFLFIKNNNYKRNSSGQSFFYAHKFIKTKEYIHLNCDCIFTKKFMEKIIRSKKKNLISVRSDVILKDKMENAQVYKNQITQMELTTNKKRKFKAYGVAKISKRAMYKHMELYKKLSTKEKQRINYFSLIRKNLKHIEYSAIKTDKRNLHEINTEKDLKDCILND